MTTKFQRMPSKDQMPYKDQKRPIWTSCVMEEELTEDTNFRRYAEEYCSPSFIGT